MPRHVTRPVNKVKHRSSKQASCSFHLARLLSASDEDLSELVDLLPQLVDRIGKLRSCEQQRRIPSREAFQITLQPRLNDTVALATHDRRIPDGPLGEFFVQALANVSSIDRTFKSVITDISILDRILQPQLTARTNFLLLHGEDRKSTTPDKGALRDSAEDTDLIRLITYVTDLGLGISFLRWSEEVRTKKDYAAHLCSSLVTGDPSIYKRACTANFQAIQRGCRYAQLSSSYEEEVGQTGTLQAAAVFGGFQPWAFRTKVTGPNIPVLAALICHNSRLSTLASQWAASHESVFQHITTFWKERDQFETVPHSILSQQIGPDMLAESDTCATGQSWNTQTIEFQSKYTNTRCEASLIHGSLRLQPVSCRGRNGSDYEYCSASSSITLRPVGFYNQRNSALMLQSKISNSRNRD